MNREITNRVILFVSIILMGIGLYGIVPHFYGYFQGDSTYQSLMKYTESAADNQNPNESENEQNKEAEKAESSPDEPHPNPFPIIDFSSLSTINPDINGWILIEDTKVNYPTVRGSDNVYYLNHMFDHKKNSAGSIFLDYENTADYSDAHSIIYGHHMKNGAMFADIEKYKSQEFYDTHPEGMLITPDKNYKIHFIAGYVANVAEDAWALHFENSEQKMQWVSESMKKSDFQSNYLPTDDDIYLTLSTCSYVFDDARYVLLGVLEEVHE